jgi:hypothetical protein
MSITPMRSGSENVSTAERISELMKQARTLATGHIHDGVLNAAIKLSDACMEIVEGGDAYPAGVRDHCRTWTMDLESRIETLKAILAKSK